MSQAQRPSAFRTVANDLREKIISGTLRPGQRLPSHRKLSETYGVGRQVVLSACQLLTTEGLLTSAPRSQTLVNPDQRARYQCDIAYVLLKENTNNQFYRHIHERLRSAVTGTEHHLTLHENVTDDVLDGIQADCLILTGFISRQILQNLKARHQRYIVLGTYLPHLWDNQIDVMLECQIQSLLETDPPHTKTVGIITDNAVFYSGRRQVDTVEHYSLRHGLPWNSSHVVVANTNCGLQEIDAVWGKRFNWPQRIVLPAHIATQFIEFLKINQIPEDQGPDLLVTTDFRQNRLPLAAYPHLWRQSTQDEALGDSLLKTCILYATDSLDEPFSGSFNPLTNTLTLYRENHEQIHVFTAAEDNPQHTRHEQDHVTRQPHVQIRIPMT